MTQLLKNMKIYIISTSTQIFEKSYQRRISFIALEEYTAIYRGVCASFLVTHLTLMRELS